MNHLKNSTSYDWEKDLLNVSLSSIVFNLLPKPKATFYSGFLQVNDILIFYFRHPRRINLHVNNILSVIHALAYTTLITMWFGR